MADPASEIIVVLGAPNDREGRLSRMGTSRGALAVAEYHRLPRPILPTGGWGPHFNTTPVAHHRYVSAYLLAAGVAPEHVLPGIDSANTYEDIDGVAHRAPLLGVRALTVITSDYHVPRVGLLLARLVPDLTVTVIGAYADLPAHQLSTLEAHEREAMHLLTGRGAG